MKPTIIHAGRITSGAEHVPELQKNIHGELQRVQADPVKKNTDSQARLFADGPAFVEDQPAPLLPMMNDDETTK